jgi:D-glycero-alpha-D-manno-heptose-7-phosphate kinase
MLCAGDFFVKRVRVLVANHPRLMRELVMATVADQPDIEVVGEVQNENDLADIVEQVQPEVLIIAINKYFYTILGNRGDGRIQVISSDLRLFGNWRDLAALPALPDRSSGLEIPLAVLKDLGTDLAADLFLASEIPPGTGLGSSASVCVNLLKVLTTYLRCPLSKYDLAERAFNVTRFGLKRHVGKQDEYAAAFGGLNYIRFSRDGATQVEPLQLDSGVLSALQSNLMLFFTGAAHHSWDILADQEKSTRLPDGPAVEALHQVKEAAALMKEALLCGDLKHFGHLLDDAWQAKKRVSQRISSQRIDHLYDVAREYGAAGGKITGAGGGGFLLLYAEPSSQAAVRSAMQSEGVQEMAFAFDSQGAQVIVNDPFIDHDQHAGTQWTFLPLSSAATV